MEALKGSLTVIRIEGVLESNELSANVSNALQIVGAFESVSLCGSVETSEGALIGTIEVRE